MKQQTISKIDNAIDGLQTIIEVMFSLVVLYAFIALVTSLALFSWGLL